MTETKFSVAIDGTTGKERTIEQLDVIPRGDERLKHLQCPMCRCGLSFRHSGVKQACFVTKKNVEHAEDCEYKVRYANARHQVKYIGEESVRLTSKMQTNRSYDMYLQIKRQLDLAAGIEPKKRSKYKRKAPKSPRKVPDTDDVNTFKLIPTVSGESTVSEEQIRGRRVPTLRRYPSTLIENDVNQTINFGGILEAIEVRDNRIWLLISFGGVEKRLIINEAALKSAPIGFSRLMLTLKEQLDSLKRALIFSCIIETIPSSKDGSIQCMVRNVSSILINGKDPVVYLAKIA